MDIKNICFAYFILEQIKIRLISLQRQLSERVRSEYGEFYEQRLQYLQSAISQKWESKEQKKFHSHPSFPSFPNPFLFWLMICKINKLFSVSGKKIDLKPET